jgi:predicted permease
MRSLAGDLRSAWRSLRRNPGLVAVASVSLSLGIAVNVVIFAGVDILILRPLAYPEPERLVQAWSTNRPLGWDQTSVSLADFADWREQVTRIDLAAYGSGDFNLTGDERPERVTGLRVSPALLPVLGGVPLLGRGFRPDEEEPGADRVVIFSHQLWQRRFGGDSTVVGRAVQLDGVPHTVIGILAPAFSFGRGTDLFAPLTLGRDEPRDNRSYEVIGRLRRGSTLAAAEADLEGIAARLARAHPATNQGMGVRLVPLHLEVVGEEATQAGTISMVAVLFVLLIACANVANLLLARGAVRARELAVRAALGAGRRDLIRQLLVEGVVLSAIGGILGLGLSVFGLRWLAAIIPPEVPRIEQLGLDGRVLGYAVLVTVLAGIGFSIAPALQGTQGSVTAALHDGGRGGSTGRGAGRLRSGFVVGELALALVLLVSAGLLIRAAVRIQVRPLGFEPGGALTFRISLPGQEFRDDAAVRATTDALLERLRAHPGVVAAGAVSRLPLSGGSGTYYQVEGEPVPEEGRRPVVQLRQATPGYPDAIGLRLAGGRWIERGDDASAPRVIVANEALVRRHWPDGNAVGRRLVLSSGTYEIVGVTRDVPEFGRDDPAPPLVFLAAAQRPARSMAIVVRTTGDPAGLAPVVRAALAEVAPTVPAYDVTTLAEVIRVEEQSELIMPKLLGVFGLLALLLAIAGVYGVMAYVVSQRRLELGIRRALGAQDGDILRLVLRYATRLAAVGLAIGLGLALGSARGLSTFLYGLSPFDPAVFTGVTLALGLATVGATLIPARRATTVAPTEVLKGE